jgi:glutathione synthetase
MPKVRKLGIVMDPIEAIKPWKDSSLAMMLEAQARDWQVFYFQLDDIFLDNGIAMGEFKTLTLYDDNEHWFDYGDAGRCRLSELDAILMRKDPPFDLEYIYCTYILEQAEESGVLVVNKPASLRDCNEKLFTRVFPQCCVDTLVSRKPEILRGFIEQYSYSNTRISLSSRLTAWEASRFSGCRRAIPTPMRLLRLFQSMASHKPWYSVISPRFATVTNAFC